MKSGLGVVLLLSAVALAATVTSELRYGTVRAGDDTPAIGVRAEAAAGDPSDLRHDPPRPLRPLEDMNATRDRPLFFEERRYPEEPTQDAGNESAPAPTPEVAVNLGSVRLSAIVIDQSERAALIHDTDTDEITRAVVGETVSGWTVQEIRPSAVVLRSGSQSKELMLRNFDEAQPERAPTASERRAERLRALQARRLQRQREAVRAKTESTGSEQQSIGRVVPPATGRSESAPRPDPSSGTRPTPRTGDCGLSRC